MKVSTMFLIAAIFLLLMGLVSFIFPSLPAFGITDPSAAFGAMIVGVALVSLGLIAWLVRNAEASKTRDSLVLGYTFLFALWALVSAYGSFLPMPNSGISWLPALIQALVAVGFFMAGRSSMAKS
jgi:hypothetical protein